MIWPYQPPSQPAPGTPAGESAIAVTTKWYWETPYHRLLTPRVRVSGREYRSPWGRRTVIPVPPGLRHVEVELPNLFWRFATAYRAVAVSPGQVVELEYRTPVFWAADGALGPPPQRHPGLRLYTVLKIGFLAALLVIVLVATVISKVSG
jgi:hypothetical protein